MGKDTGPKGDILLEVGLGEAIAAQLKLRGLDICKVGVEDSEGVELCNVVTPHLVCTDEELDLRVINYSLPLLKQPSLHVPSNERQGLRLLPRGEQARRRREQGRYSEEAGRPAD